MNVAFAKRLSVLSITLSLLLMDSPLKPVILTTVARCEAGTCCSQPLAECQVPGEPEPRKDYYSWDGGQCPP